MLINTDGLGINALEREWEAIRDEAVALPDHQFLPWMQRHMYDEDWSLVPLNWAGQDILDMREHCPRTLGALASVPGLAMAVFSRLRPGTTIIPHEGWGSRVFRVHLGLVIPDNCWLEVAGTKHRWQEGRCLAFDDTIEHGAANLSDHTRLVLMLDVLRPGLEPPAYNPHSLPHELQAMIPMLERGVVPARDRR